MMKNYICITCGAQYAPTDKPPASCKICRDERQYVGWAGQQWTTLEEMWHADYHNRIQEIEPGLIGIGTQPQFAIGQRALLVRTGDGNLLWDPISYLDSRTVEAVHSLGGISAIAVSHPHFYASMVEWSLAFDNAPIYLPDADQAWIMRPSDAIVFFKEKARILPGITAVRCGGHFPGSSVLHWQDGAGGQGALLAGDTIMVAMDRQSVSFMYSYPNLIPLAPEKVYHAVEAVRPFRFERLYSAWWDREIKTGAKTIVSDSAKRYAEFVSDSASRNHAVS
jgi:glyoxylase-like metal-dependent hydrolase (beta-lactamase superfamily II)